MVHAAWRLVSLGLAVLPCPGCATMLTWGCLGHGCDISERTLDSEESEAHVTEIYTSTGHLVPPGLRRIVIAFEPTDPDSFDGAEGRPWSGSGRFLVLDLGDLDAKGDRSRLEGLARFESLPSDDPGSASLALVWHRDLNGARTRAELFASFDPDDPGRAKDFWLVPRQVEFVEEIDLLGMKEVGLAGNACVALRLEEVVGRSRRTLWWRILITPVAVGWDAGTLPVQILMGGIVGIVEAVSE